MFFKKIRNPININHVVMLLLFYFVLSGQSLFAGVWCVSHIKGYGISNTGSGFLYTFTARLQNGKDARFAYCYTGYGAQASQNYQTHVCDVYTKMVEVAMMTYQWLDFLTSGTCAPDKLDPTGRVDAMLMGKGPNKQIQYI